MEMNKNGTDNLENDKYEKVPPEGGWGYIVCLGLSAIFIACSAHLPIFGFIYNDFLLSLGEGTSAVTTTFGLQSFMVAIGGFATNIFLKTLSLRQVGLLGAFAYTSGTFFGIFITSTWQLFITNGLLQGFGFGVMIPIAYTSFNSYFTMKKVLYFSLCKASICFATMFYPTLMKYTMENYGFRGTLAILCGIGAQSIVGVIVLQPVEYHLVKRKKKRYCEEETLMIINDIIKEKDFSGLQESLLHKAFRKDSLVTVDDKKSFHNSSENKVFIANLCKATSHHSLGEFGGVAGAELLTPIKNKQRKWMTFVEFLALNLFKDKIYSNICIGMALSFFADQTFFALDPLYLYKQQYTKKQISTIITVGGAADMSARLGLALAGQFFSMKARYIFFTGSLLAAIGRIVFTFSNDYNLVLILTGILGSLRSLLHIPMAIVLADYLPTEQFPAGYGLYMLVQGLVNLTWGPAVGLVRDLTGSYALTFHLLTTCNLLCVVPWFLEAVLKRKQTNINDFIT